MENRKFFAIFLFSALLSGCQLDMKRTVEDFSGADAAKIRVLDKGKLSLVFYEKVGDCYKEGETRKLTSAFHFSLLSNADFSTGSEKKINMTSPSSFGDKKVKEYAIKPDQALRIVNTNTVQDYFGNNIAYTRSLSFMSEKNHEYEVYAQDPQFIRSAGDIIINDLTTNEHVKEWDAKVCEKQ